MPASGKPPQTVAVIGASADRHKFGNKAVRAFLHSGYDVVPINQHEQMIEGLQVYASVLDVPRPIDLATIYVHPEDGQQVLAEIAQKGIPELWVNPGADSPAILARARELGLEPVVGCSLIAIGESPADYQE